MKKIKQAILTKDSLKLGETIQAKTVSEIKLKDQVGRDVVTLDCMEHFGYLPQYLVIAKVRGRNNCFNVSGMIKTKLDLKKAAAAKLGGSKAKNE